MAREIGQPSDLELQVLGLLWREGPLTARQAGERLPDGKPRAYTTVLSVLQGMEKKKLVSHTRDGLTHVYRPAVTRRQVLGPVLRNLVGNVFGGHTGEAVMHLIEENKVDEQELEAIRRVIDEHEASASAKKKSSRPGCGGKR